MALRALEVRPLSKKAVDRDNGDSENQAFEPASNHENKEGFWMHFDTFFAPGEIELQEVLISDSAEQVALADVFEKQLGSRSGAFDNLTLNAKGCFELVDTLAISGKLVALTDISIGRSYDSFARGDTTGVLLEKINKVIGEVTNDQVHDCVSSGFDIRIDAGAAVPGTIMISE